jgi:antibiotic biosynthesis monooxygenase (ABM) superfamily enzyme
VITALVVPTMSYLVSPQLTRLFKKWLYPGPS